MTGLERNDRDMVRSVPKSDLHIHGGLGFRREILERWAGRLVTPPPFLMSSIKELDNWIRNELKPFNQNREFIEFTLKADMAEARNDTITVLEMSVDIYFMDLYGNDAERFGRMIHEAHQLVAPGITFRPEVGIARDMDPARSLPLAMQCIETNLFTGIDLYGTETARKPEVYHDLYYKAKKKGLKCKAHAGEFGDAATMLHTAQVLELDAIQHGIAAASSPDAMQWLSDNSVTFNICPTSNIRLSRSPSYATHPIRRLYDAGISVTINSDDIMIFDQNVSDEYLHLFRAGTLSASELDQIRLNGLHQ